jgi:hypothetical protein
MSYQFACYSYQIVDNGSDPMLTGFLGQEIHLHGYQQILCNLPRTVEGTVGVDAATRKSKWIRGL